MTLERLQSAAVEEFRVEHGLFAVEVHRAFEPALDGFAATEQRAVDLHGFAVRADDR